MTKQELLKLAEEAKEDACGEAGYNLAVVVIELVKRLPGEV